MTKLVLALAAVFVGAAAEEAKKPAPLFSNLGKLHHPITTKSKEAQRYFATCWEWWAAEFMCKTFLHFDFADDSVRCGGIPGCEP